jgi:exo-beta-1,3-glucanase (GH17 family)/GT2 family glycosyltransferase
MSTIRPTDSLLILAIVAGTLLAWAASNRPAPAPAWPEQIGGFAVSPLTRGQEPARGDVPTMASIAGDLALLSTNAHAVRTYSSDGIYASIPTLAARYGLDVTAGVVLNDDAHDNALRLERFGAMASQSRNVTRAILGNETVLTETLSAAELVDWLSHARRYTTLPISTAEPWHIWLAHPELVAAVDFITVHLLPYWEGIAAEDAVDYLVSRMHALEAAYPGKPIVIGEVGWPSFGRTRNAAVASPANAAAFVREFLARADREGYDYFLMEAFDQPWKRTIEGEAGAYWGIYDVDRQPKYALAGPVAPLDAWPPLALAAALVAIGLFTLMVTDGGRLGARGRAFVAALAATVATAAIWIFAVHTPSYWTLVDTLAGVLLFGGLLGIVVLVLVEAHEWAEALWCARAQPDTTAPATGTRLPKVSIHVPAYQEPPELLAETLRALAELDYPDFEVVVIDNNTRDERLWRPVEALCAALGPRFRFFHVAPLAGYKAGALNFALERMAQDAEIVAVIDSDYKVERRWLRDLVPQFADPEVAIVQAPQDYRDGGQSPFKAMCNAEYQGFFRIGMVTRSDRNAIVQHGTMTMIRKSVLNAVGRWDEHTITEDAELGLRVLEHGHAARYVPVSYGKGLTPDNFLDYKVQRFRWAFGAMQILRRHRASLFGHAPSRLSRGQRYHFVVGWLPWIADGLCLAFTVIAIAWSAVMMILPTRSYPPVAAFTAFVIALFAFKLVKVLVLYRYRVRASFGETFGAGLAGLALAFTVGRAVLTGFVRREAPFRRTPKLAHRHSLVGAFAAAAPETVLAVTLLGCAAGVAATAPFPSIDRSLWCVQLMVFAVPHVAALQLSLISALPRRRRHRDLSTLTDALSDTRRA